MQEKPPMNIRQMGIVSFIHGVTAFLTCFVFLYAALGPLAQSNRGLLLCSTGIVGVLAVPVALYLCAEYFRARGNERTRSNQRVLRWRRIFKRAFEGGLGAFILSTGVLILARISISSSLLAGLTIALAWSIAIILIYYVWPEGLSIDRWLRWL